MNPAVVDHLTVLSDTIRVRMLAVLEGRELTVSELCDIIQLPQSTVSRHLKTLSDGDWVSSRRDGTRRLYTLPLDDIDPSAKRLWQVVREQVTSSATASHDDRRLKQVLARRRTQSEAFFSSAAGQWDRLREELFGPTSHLRALAGLLDPGLVVGDLGCGTGKVSEWLGLFARRIIAVDVSKEMLEAASENLAGQSHIEVRRGSLEKLPIKNGELDLALMMLVLHHLPEPKRALAEAARALSSGGRLLILDMLPHEREEYRQTMGHVWLGFGEKQMTQWLEAAGFKEIRWRALPPESKTKGPTLFVATARRE
ncbi:MAG: metalloregulator ArsR/SmtB family transcription factor [Acidobacteria bacterium]|nr:metalloregulator ArsR/SmtB family transcription factor [Acidobacteriota bacterium]